VSNISEAFKHLRLAKYEEREMTHQLNKVRDMQADITDALGDMVDAYHQIASPPDKTLVKLDTFEVYSQ
jgi:hypothetical protein